MRTPSYTTLAPELLYMIAEHVAKVDAHEKKDQKISKDLLKMRLVCKQFSEVATATFLSLIQTNHYDDYTTLHLPPKSGSLDLVASALSAKGSMSSIVTNVKYHVVRSPVREPDYEEWLYDVVSEGGEAGDCSCGLHHGSTQTIDRAMSKNMSRFRKLCQAQDSFAEDLLKPSSARRLRDILARLPKLASVHVDLFDFWSGSSCDFLESEDETPPSSFYKSAFPVLLEAIGSSGAKELKSNGFGSYCLGGLHPLLINKLGRKKDFLKNIVNIDLVMTHCDDIGELDYGEPYLTSLRRGDRLNLLLSCVKNLERLSLSYNDDTWFSGLEIHGDEQWLEDVFQAQKWPGLKSLTLRKFHIKTTMLLILFRTHKATLNQITLDNIKGISATDWLLLLSFMRGNLKLTAAIIELNKRLYSSFPDLNKIISDCDQARSPSTDMVDVGGYLLPQAREVIELE